MEVHCFSTGSVHVRPVHAELGRLPGALRFPAILLDRRRVGPLPMNVYCLRTPAGTLLFDTGETVRATDPARYATDPVLRVLQRVGFLRYAIRPGEDAADQLAARGVEPDDVRWVVLSHLHLDHVGGLRHFPDAEVLVARTELEVQSGPHRRGSLPSDWPRWFDPTLVDYADGGVGEFDASHDLTGDGTMRLLPTPGHSPGHQSLLVTRSDREDHAARPLLLAGDATFSQDQLLSGGIPGISDHLGQARSSARRLRHLVDHLDAVYLPAHDPAAAERLRAAS